MINPQLLDLLACPMCGGDVAEQGEEIVCSSCQKRFPVENGIPIMLPDRAKAADNPKEIFSNGKD